MFCTLAKWRFIRAVEEPVATLGLVRYWTLSAEPFHAWCVIGGQSHESLLGPTCEAMAPLLDFASMNPEQFLQSSEACAGTDAIRPPPILLLTKRKEWGGALVY